MKLHDPALNIEIQGEVRVANFGMKHTRKSFHMVTSGIYSNKIRAIVRELSTNAWDSHFVAKKKDVPFEVHLPNSFEPYFAVIDNGTGMSEDFVFERYTTYFDSDKTDTDDLTGCWGLGSKTPFMNGDSFTVRSRYNGKVKIYTSYFDNDGLPAIAKMGEEDTDECNGVEVSFPVKESDFHKFHAETADVLSWFTPRPIVKGCADFEFKEEQYIKKNENYGITKSYRGHSNLIMGNVSYPIGSHDVSLSNVERKIIEHGVDIFVPMGKGVEVTIGREKLSYTDGTVAIVKQYVAEVLESIKEEVEEEFEKAPTLWQARRMLHDFRHSILGHVKSLVSIKWQGKEVIDHVNLENLKLGTEPKLQYLSKRKQKYMRSNQDTLIADGHYVFHNDLDWGGYSRITNYLHEQGQNVAYVLTDFDQQFLDFTGVGEVLVKSSSLPKPQRTKSARTFIKKHTAKLLKFGYSSSDSARDSWEADDVEMSDGGIYVTISHYCPLTKDGVKQSPGKLQGNIKRLKALNDEDITVYGIRKIDVPKLRKYGNWTEFTDYATEVLKDNKDFCDEYVKRQQIQRVDKNYSCYLDKCFADDSLFGKFLDEYKEAMNAEKNDQIDSFIYLNNHFLVHTLDDNERDKLESMEKEINEAYPLLRYGNNWNVNFVNSVVAYIQSKDANPDLEIEPLSAEKVALLSYLDWDRYQRDNGFLAFVIEHLCGEVPEDISKYSLLQCLDCSRHKNDSQFMDSMVEYVQIRANTEDEESPEEVAV